MKYVLAFLGVTAVLAVIGTIVIYSQNRKPQIELGLVDGKLREIPEKPNCVSTQTSQEDKLVAPMAFKDSLDATKEAFKQALESYGDIEIIEEEGNYLYAVATTGLMKYHDDIEVYFDEDNQVIQFRSASRAGYSDMGLNKERYEQIKTYYQQ